MACLSDMMPQCVSAVGVMVRSACDMRGMPLITIVVAGAVELAGCHEPPPPSHPPPSRPSCPAAIEFPDDYTGHVAALDAAGTQERAEAWRSEPLLRHVEWCCYGTAPLAAIGPL